MESLNFELLLKTINKSDLGIVLLDVDLKVLLWNDWMAIHSGKQASQVVHQSLVQVCPEIKGSRTSEAIVNTLKTGQPAVISNVFNRTPFNLYPKGVLSQENQIDPSNLIQQALKIIPLLVAGKSHYCLIQISDVSAAVKREAALEQQIRDRKKAEQVLSDERALFITGPTVVLTWTASPEPKINYISPNVELMLGFTEQQFTQTGFHFISLLHPMDVEKYNKEIEINSNNDSPYFEQEFRLINAIGEYRWFYSLTTINRDSSGNILRYLGYLLDITERKSYQDLVEHHAYYDELTGLPNRRMFIDRLKQELGRAKRHGYMGALFFIDIDRFKIINDSLGHKFGDLLLKLIAGRLKSCIRLEDTVARLGGDEFVVILSNPGGTTEGITQDALIVAKKIRTAIGEKFQLNEHEVHSTASIGIVTFPNENTFSTDDLLRFADTAMYKAKNEGRSKIRFFNPDMQKHVDERLHLEESLRIAIDREEFTLSYQPLFDNQNSIISAEALVRWQHPTKGWISPADFIPLAEETGLIIYLGEWVLREACRQLKQWESSSCFQLPQIAVNVSPKQFRQPNFVSQVKQILAEFEVCPERLVIELTEGIVIADVNDTVKKMNALQSLGIRIAIDDFGTGYSSLTYLNTLPIDVLKIDQSFIRDISNDNNTAIVGTIISMAKHLDLKVIAEGVETEGELKYLISAGCRMFQGNFFSKPISADVFVKLHVTNQKKKITFKIPIIKSQ